MREQISRLLAECGTANALMPPTQLFNEGWLLRLTLDSVQRLAVANHPLALLPGARWYSEALLASRFLPRTRGDKLAESHTHADAVVGHFDLRSGEVRLRPDARQFEVIEAKLGSPLSSRTTNAADYDQAARNVACMVHLLADAKVETAAVSRFSFFVIAPQSQIDAGVFGDLVSAPSIRRKVLSRVAAYEGEHDRWHQDVFEPLLERVCLQLLSWEDAISSLPASDERAELESFYDRCRTFNPAREARVAI